MRTCFYTLFIVLLCLLSFQTAHSQLIANGDFEFWTGNCPTNTPPDLWTNYSTQLGPDQAGACMGTVQAHSGSSYMNLVWINSGIMEGASQTLQNCTLGSVYRISFWAINSNGIYADPGDCIVQIHQNSTPIYTGPNLTPGGAWTYYSVDFTAQSPIQPIGIRVTQGAAGTSGSVGVDDFAVTELVGITDGMMRPLTVYPIPAQESVYIDQGDYVVAQFDEAPFSIVNVLGQEMVHDVCTFSDGKGRVDVSSLEAGVYYLKVRVDGEVYVRKMVVE